jgi:hypothetical protein
MTFAGGAALAEKPEAVIEPPFDLGGRHGDGPGGGELNSEGIPSRRSHTRATTSTSKAVPPVSWGAGAGLQRAGRRRR